MNKFFRHALYVVCVLALGPILVGEAMAERRVALVVGNAKYEHAGTLVNTISDANAVGVVFTKAGFDVVEVRRDVGVVEFKRAIREFSTAALDADIAVVYYSGHGFEIGGVNYLIPVDAKLASDDDVEDETIPLDRMIQATQSAKKLSLIILDACRDNPFLRSPAHAGPKLAVANRMAGVETTGAGTLIAYAAKAGSVSYDGAGANSPFTTALVKYIAEPGLDIRLAFGKVRDDVLASTNNQQEPFVYGSLGGGNISLVPPPSAPKGPVAATAGDAAAAAAADYAMAERVGSRQGWQAFIAMHGSGYYANLARAQLAKLTGTAPPVSEAQKPLGNTAGIAPRDAAPHPPDVAAEGKDELHAPPRTANAVAIPPLTPAQACKADAARLAQLRLNPNAEQVARFSRELACDDLRPQVQRFAESLGIEPAIEPRSPALEPAASAATGDIGQACKREADDLARIRANPDRTSALRFARDLKCEDLRAQVVRLLDSIGD